MGRKPDVSSTLVVESHVRTVSEKKRTPAKATEPGRRYAMAKPKLLLFRSRIAMY